MRRRPKFHDVAGGLLLRWWEMERSNAIFGTMTGNLHQGSRAATEDLSHPIGFGLSVAGPGTFL